MKTTTFSVGSGAQVAIAPTIMTKTIVILEDPSVGGWPTTAFKITAPTSSDTEIRRPSGSSFEISSEVPMPAGRTVAYIKTVTGTTTFQQIEDGF